MLPSFLENSSRVAQRPAQAQVPIHRPSSFQFTFATWRPCRQCTQRKRVLHAVSHRIAGSARCQQAVVSRATVRPCLSSALASSNPSQRGGDGNGNGDWTGATVQKPFGNCCGQLWQPENECCVACGSLLIISLKATVGKTWACSFVTWEEFLRRPRQA